MRVVFSHHDTDHRDARVHFAKRQLVQDLCLSAVQDAIEPGPRLSPRINRRPKSQRVCLTRPGLAAEMRLVLRVSVALLFLLGRSIKQRVSRLLQLSCRPASAFKLRRPFDLSFSSICLFESVLLGAVSSET